MPAPLKRRSEVLALTYAMLRAADRLALLPAADQVRARDEYLSTLGWNLGRFARLDAALAAAREAGLRVVVLKGGLLARTHYRDPGARPMVDLDLACDPHDTERLVALWCGLGMQRWLHPQFRIAGAATHDVKLVEGPLVIELHFRMWHELRLGDDLRGLLARAVEVPFGGATAWAPALADHLFLVLVHAATHGFAGNPLWLTDAALLAAEATGDTWAEVERLAAQAGASLPLAAALDHLCLVFPELFPSRSALGPAPLRRAVLRRLAPWLQRGEPELGLLPSRIVRPLLVERPGALVGWLGDKLRLWWSSDAQSREP